MVAGTHTSVENAVKEMVREVDRIEPDESIHQAYTHIFNNVYSKLAPTVAPVVHAIHDLRGGASSFFDNDDRKSGKLQQQQLKRQVIVSPSLLAGDWSDIRGEINRCVLANITRLHIDVFDGVFLNSPLAFTFGPQMIAAMRRCNQDIILDAHLCVYKPHRFVNAMADAGVTRFIFQWEAMDSIEDALDLVHSINAVGMKCGVSVNPSTGIEHIYPLLETNMVDTVNILAVEAGFGGQRFNPVALHKLKQLKQWRSEHNADHVKFLVDGGINQGTASQVIVEGADIMVAGTFLFNHLGGIEEGVKELLNAQ